MMEFLHINGIQTDVNNIGSGINERQFNLLHFTSLKLKKWHYIDGNDITRVKTDIKKKVSIGMNEIGK